MIEGSIWAIAIPVLSVVIVGIGIFIANASKYYTIREQEAFSGVLTIALNNIRSELAGTQQDIERELDQIHMRISVLEQTRPTTGELQARLGGVMFGAKNDSLRDRK